MEQSDIFTQRIYFFKNIYKPCLTLQDSTIFTGVSKWKLCIISCRRLCTCLLYQLTQRPI